MENVGHGEMTTPDSLEIILEHKDHLLFLLSEVTRLHKLQLQETLQHLSERLMVLRPMEVFGRGETTTMDK